jgi:transposase
MRYINLTQLEIQDLESMELTTVSQPLRDRTQCLLMSNKGAKVKELSLYFDVVPKTIFEWFNLWDSGGCLGILHKSGTGRKAKLKDISATTIEEIIKKYPRNLKGAIAELFETHHVKISVKTLQRYIKKTKLYMA